jgi:hypothetical protein
MTSARSVALVCLVLAGLTAAAVGCGEHPAEAPVVVPSDVHLAAAAPAPGFAPVAPLNRGALWLDAVRTVELYCRLIDEGQFARAGELCARRALWSRRRFRGLRTFRFRSARVHAIPDARTIVLEARVRMRAGRGSPLRDGLDTLFFTLGRAGSAVGGWLITAVSTGP